MYKLWTVEYCVGLLGVPLAGSGGAIVKFSLLSSGGVFCIKIILGNVHMKYFFVIYSLVLVSFKSRS